MKNILEQVVESLFENEYVAACINAGVKYTLHAQPGGKVLFKTDNPISFRRNKFGKIIGVDELKK